jgi:DNA-binding GntR family transcriptional regulator
MSLLSLAPAALAPTTLSADVFQRLREDILSGRFSPDDKLRLHDLKEHYEVGFSPLREALMYLASDGLVVVEHQKGFRVAPISLDDLWDVTRTRQMIEEKLLTEAVEHGDDAWESEIVASFHRLEKLPSTDPTTGFVTPEWAKRHYAFHRALISGARSRLLKRFWQMAYDQSDRYRRISASIAGSREDEHKKLMKAALARDTEALIKLNQKHIEKTAKVVAEQFANVGKSALPVTPVRGRRKRTPAAD